MTRNRCAVGVLLFVALTTLTTSAAEGPFMANGIKIGEVDQTSAIIWTRLTRAEAAAETLENAAPGAEGSVRISYTSSDAAEHGVSDWTPVDPDRDFTHQFRLAYLKPGATYRIRVEAKPLAGYDVTCRVDGTFRTPPPVDSQAPVEFIVVTCQALSSVDSGSDGHSAYRLMPKLDADFFVHTGDVVYYDREPFCQSQASARERWNRMYGYFANRDFHAGVSAYFMKDDHDTLKNDCWPGQSYGELTFEQGLAVFREQVPMGEKTYRTVRWGKDVQIWMTENRDFRSLNIMRDGPDKTILGAEQKAWLQETLAASDATFKFLIMPGPLVGPDKKGKNDNHCNAGFQTEGDWLRALVASQKNMFVINGDRHWQYWSIHPELKINEFGCGPINDIHGYGGNPGYRPEYHGYFAANGGFLSVSVDRTSDGPTATARWWGVAPDLEEPFVRFEKTFAAE